MFLFQISFRQLQEKPGFQEQAAALEHLLYKQNLEGHYNTTAALQERRDAAFSLYGSIADSNRNRPGHQGNEPQLKVENREAVRALALCFAVFSELKAQTTGQGPEDNDPLVVGVWNAIDRIRRTWPEDKKPWGGQFAQDTLHYSHYLAVTQGGLQKLSDGRLVYLFEKKAVSIFTSILDRAAQEKAGDEKKWRNFRLGEKYVEPFKDFLEQMPYMHATVKQVGNTDVSFAFDYVSAEKTAPQVSEEEGQNGAKPKQKAKPIQLPKVVPGKQYGYGVKEKKDVSRPSGLVSLFKRLEDAKEIADQQKRAEADEKNRNASAKKTLDQMASTQLTYAAKTTRIRVGKSVKLEFDPKSPEAKAQAYNLALLELRTLALDLGYSEAKQEISDFLLTERGAKFLSEIAQKKLVIYGGATNEEPEAYQANLALAKERAKMIRDAMVQIIDASISRRLAVKNLGKAVRTPLGSSRDERYASPLDGGRSEFSEQTMKLYPKDIEIKPIVTSIWGKEGQETLNALFLRLRNTFTKGMPECENASEEERGYAQQIYNSFTRPQAKGQTAAVGVMPNDTFSISNEKLAMRLMRRMKSDPTLKSKAGGDALGLRYEGAVPQSEREKMGAYFVDLLEHSYRITDATVDGKAVKTAEVSGFTRTGGTQRQIDASLNLAMTALPAQIKSGAQEMEVEFSVNYAVDGIGREFITTENGGFAANYLVKDKDGNWGGEKTVEFTDKPAVYRDMDGNVTRTVFRGKISGLPEGGVVRVYASANKFDLESDHAGQDVEIVEKPEKHEVLDPYRVTYPIRAAFITGNLEMNVPSRLETQFGGKDGIDLLRNAVNGAGNDFRNANFDKGFEKLRSNIYDPSLPSDQQGNRFYSKIMSNPATKASWQDLLLDKSDAGLTAFFTAIGNADFASAQRMIDPSSASVAISLLPVSLNLSDPQTLFGFLQYEAKSHQISSKINLADGKNGVINLFVTYNRDDFTFKIESKPVASGTSNMANVTIMAFSMPLEAFATFGVSYGQDKTSVKFLDKELEMPETNKYGLNASVGFQFDFDTFLGKLRARPELTGQYWWADTQGEQEKTWSLTPSIEITTKDYIKNVVRPYWRGHFLASKQLLESQKFQYIGTGYLGAMVKPFANMDLGMALKEMTIDTNIGYTTQNLDFSRGQMTFNVGITVPLGLFSPSYTYTRQAPYKSNP